MKALPVDGNNVLDVHAASVLAARECRSGRGPVLILAETFRMGGHATHDESEARRQMDPQLFREWGSRDPIGLYEEYLCRRTRALDPGGGVAPDLHDPVRWNRELLSGIEEEVRREVEAAQREALRSRELFPAEAGPDERLDCYDRSRS
jgi:hypothetical protein